MNAIKLKIGYETYTGRVSAPLTVQTTLNDTLDSAQFILPYLQRAEPFEPMTDVELQIGESEAVIWLLADDQVQEITGTGRYTHTVTLVEYTKITERILMEAKSFSNPLITDYAEGDVNPEVYMYSTTALNIWNVGAKFATGTTNYYNLPTAVPGTIKIPVHDISLLIGDDAFSSCNNPNNINLPFWTRIYFSDDPPVLTESKYIPTNASLIYEYEYGVDSENPALEKPTAPIEYYTETGGYYTIIYIYSVTQTSGVAYYAAVTTLLTYEKVPRRDPYTIQEVIDILLEVSSPLRAEDVCEWALAEDQKDLPCMMQKSPEFAFADSRSLWENLREIGRVIHAIPRVIKKGEKDDNGSNKKVRFDFLGGSAQADFSNGKRISRYSSLDIANYTAGLETMAANLISATGNSDGTIIEPYGGGYKSLRTATETARIQEGTSFIETSLPIESIVKAEAYFTYNSNSYSCDITPYVFEKDDYDLLLSYSGSFPKAKCFALYYSRGSQNINGLWFKATDGADAFANSLKNYAIANILSQEAKLNIGYFDQLSYPNISFRVEYIPTVTARVHHYRPDAKRGAGLLANNQAANKLSAYALGENMRGQLAMLSTSARSELWLFPKYEDIPKAGELVDDSLYISSVTARIYPGYCEAQIEMSENYNEQGAFVEMPSKFRQYEIPTGNERHTVIDEFCYISDTPSPDVGEVLAGQGLKGLIGYGISCLSYLGRVSLAIATTYDEDGNVLADKLRFPVMGLAIGNSLYFGFSMRDNYAAGNKSIEGGKQYRMNQAVRYGDRYYATAYAIGFKLVKDAQPASASDSIADANAFPDTDTAAFSEGNTVAGTGANPLIWYKDSADAGNIAYQIHFLSDSGYIIGSNLAASCSAVRSTMAADDTQLYFFSERLHPINGISDVEKAIGQGAPHPVIHFGFCDAGGHKDAENGNVLYVSTNVINDVPSGTKSWAIIRGGKFLLGRNESTPPKKIYFNFRRSIKK